LIYADAPSVYGGWPVREEGKRDVRSIVDREPVVEHNARPGVVARECPEMKEITDGGYLELVNEFEVPGRTGLPHSHPTHEFIYVMTAGHHDHRGRGVPGRPGDLVHIPPDKSTASGR